ncbi:MAG: hypothetical protein ACOCPM_05660, partial [Bacteroidales bacterium]
SDLLQDSIVNTNNQEVWLTMSRDIYELSPDSLVAIPENIDKISYKTPFNLEIIPGKKLINTSVNKKIQANPAELSSAVVQKGVISVETKSTYDQPVKYTYRFPGIKKNGQSLIITDTVEATNSGTITTSQNYNIQDYRIDMTGKNNDAFNQIFYQVTAQTTNNADTLYVTPQDSLALNINFKELQFHQIEGYFGQKDFSITDTTTIDFLSHIESGVIDLDSIYAELKVENGLGADLKLNVNDLISINRNNNQTIALTGNFMNSDISIARAVKNSSITPVIKTIDLSNSNMEEFIENLPEKIAHNLNAELNPLGNISMGNDFYNSNYPLKISMNMDIPLKLSMDDIWLTDTIDLDVDEEAPFQNANMTLILQNYFPADASVIVKTISQHAENKTITTNNNTIAAGVLNAQNIVDQPSESLIDLNIPQKAITDLKDTGKLLVKINLQTQNLKMLQFYEHYKIDYELRGNSTIRINAN